MPDPIILVEESHCETKDKKENFIVDNSLTIILLTIVRRVPRHPADGVQCPAPGEAADLRPLVRVPVIAHHRAQVVALRDPTCSVMLLGIFANQTAYCL